MSAFGGKARHHPRTKMSVFDPKRKSANFSDLATLRRYRFIHWQRDRRIENVFGIIATFGFCKTTAIWTVAFDDTGLIVSWQEVWISAGKGHRTKGIESGVNPLAVSLLRGWIRCFCDRGENLDQNMITSEAKCCRLEWNERCGTFEFVGKNGAPRRDGSFHRLDKDVDAAGIEGREPTAFHIDALTIDEIWVECRQRSAVGLCICGSSDQRSQGEEGCDFSFAVGRRTAPCHPHKDHGAIRSSHAADLSRQLIRC